MQYNSDDFVTIYNEKSYADKVLHDLDEGKYNITNIVDGRYRCPFEQKILSGDITSLGQHAFALSKGDNEDLAKVRAEHKAMYEFLEMQGMVPKKKNDGGAGPSKKKRKKAWLRAHHNKSQ